MLVELPSPGTGMHEYTATLPDRLRDRHLRFERDESVCSGPLLVNGHKLHSTDAMNVFNFAAANRILLSGCLERTPKPISLLATLKVYLASATLHWDQRAKIWLLSVKVRNTLANSVSVSLLASFGQNEAGKELFLGPETVQAIQFPLQTIKDSAKSVQIEMEKHEEALEGAYRQIVVVPVPRRD